ncbi:MAG: penicillin-binding transpeptidase domain-containing protein [Candidatus Paceibacterota bacterium]
MRSFLKTLKRIFGSRRGHEVHPEDILLDAHNLPQFDQHQMEGRFARRISFRVIATTGIVFALIAVVYAGRLANLQIIGGEAFAQRSQQNRLRHDLIFSERGTIFDRDRTQLAWNYTASSSPDFAHRGYATTSGLAHVLGYLKYPSQDSSGVYYRESYEGKSGVEEMFDGYLSGTNGVKIIEIDATNDVRSESTVRPPEDGRNLQLAIDADVQHKLFELLRQRVNESGFRGGAGAIMDVETGELLALTSYPEHNPQVMTDGDRAGIEEIQAREGNPFLNRAVAGSFVAGSIVKPYLALGALNEGIISPQKTIVSTGVLEVPNPYDPDNPTKFTDWKAHGAVDMREALAVSSNVYFYQIGGGYEGQPGLGITKIKKYMNMFGFGEETGIDLSGEKTGVIPSPEWKQANFDDQIWRVGDTYNTSIGQYGVLVTPLQALRAVASIANGGHLVRPTVLQSDRSQIGDERDIPIADHSFQVVREGMRRAVTSGTASGLNTSYLRVAAKTGTAEIGKASVNSWVTGFYPYDNPQYAFTILLERGPRENLYGGVWVMRNLLDWMHQEQPMYTTF